MLLNKTYECFA